MFSLRATAVSIAKVTDGTSNTLLVGEAKRGVDSNGAQAGTVFQWMDPWSVISTVNGINSPAPYNTAYYNHCFGSRHVGGAQFLLVDGTVRFISENINLFTFTFLGTKAGNETLGEF
jgi:hypothetical protein